MRIDVVTLFPEFIDSCTGIGVVGRAQERGLLQVHTCNPRDFATDNHRTVDSRPFGGGPGMLMAIAPLRAALGAVQSAMEQPARVVYLSPQGVRLTQEKVAEYARLDRLILLCGRYEGVDERVLENLVDEEVSLGDYVLSGGELAAAVVIDLLDLDTAIQQGFDDRGRVPACSSEVDLNDVGKQGIAIDQSIIDGCQSV